MARYIDVEPLEKYCQERFNYLFNESETQIEDRVVIDKEIQTGAIIAKEFLDKIRSQTTADVAEVVRKAVKGYEGYYEVDQFGRVYSVDRVISVNDNGRQYDKPLKAKQMKQTMHSKGYKTVSLTKDGKTKGMFVHRIVAEAFLPNENNLPMVNHKDEDKTNNFVENLEWCTASYNRTYGNAVEKQAKKLRGKSILKNIKRKFQCQ